MHHCQNLFKISVVERSDRCFHGKYCLIDIIESVYIKFHEFMHNYDIKNDKKNSNKMYK
jgi:hypothetical protein